MSIRAKLTVAFSAACLFLIAVGIAAIVLVQHLNDILDSVRHYDYQAQLVNCIQEDLRRDPTQTARSLADLNELRRFARGKTELDLIQAARTVLVQNRAGAANKLGDLATYYHNATVAAHDKLRRRHHTAVMAVIFAMIDGLVLVVLIMNLVRYWLLRPVERLQVAAYQLAAGDLNHQLPVTHDQEFATLAASLGRLAGSVRELRERAAKSDRLAVVGEGCSQVVHGLRTPLETIRALAAYQRGATRPPAETQAAFDHIVATVDILERWVRDTIHSVRPLEPQLARKPIEPVVRDVLSLLQTKLDQHTLRVELDVGDTLPDVEIDRALLEQALLAVLENAIEASPPNEPIQVGVQRRPAGGIELSVQDHGDGMSDNTRQRAFDSFYSTKPDRAGLGLAIAQRIISLHRGTIDLDSQSGQGTRVVIRLPPVTAPTSDQKPA